MVEFLMMLTLLVLVVSQLLPDDEENEPPVPVAVANYSNHIWRAPRRSVNLAGSQRSAEMIASTRR